MNKRHDRWQYNRREYLAFSFIKCLALELCRRLIPRNLVISKGFYFVFTVIEAQHNVDKMTELFEEQQVLFLSTTSKLRIKDQIGKTTLVEK